MYRPPLQIIDTHTEGEPTRVVVAGAPELMIGSMQEKAREFAQHHDWVRSSVCNEPRGHDAMVGAILTEPQEPDCCSGVIFFNNVGTLNMCIHGSMGVARALVHMGRIGVGNHRVDTPVGVVTVIVSESGLISVENVPSYRKAAAVSVDVPGWGRITGDIAWGGNWFFLIQDQGPEVKFENLPELNRFTWAVRKVLEEKRIMGDHGMLIDHIEVFGPPTDKLIADSRNFVMCPGGAYDRSPCGTGTSAKLACLHASGQLGEGEVWRQASILDTVFLGTVEDLGGGKVLPRISGRAWVTGQSDYFFDPSDPFQFGIARAL